ncbi:MAG: tetratricopeptide repeat protein, partial [Lishizhenia sp.]|nr:tetratricopeptide repeat protein [Lishizhenia sp.]
MCLVFLILVPQTHAHQSIIELSAKANNFLNDSQFDSALVYFEKVKQHPKITDQQLGEVYLKMAQTNKLMEEYKYALFYLNKAETHNKTLYKIEELAKVYVYFVEFYRSLAKYEKAEKYIALFEDLQQKHNLSPQVLAHYYNRRAALAMEAHADVKEVIAFSRKALDLANEMQDKELQAISFNEIGFVYLNIQNPEALSYFQKALDIWRDQGNHRSMVTVLENIARLHFNNGAYTKALQTCDEALL